jgi:hypothetical protein
MQRDIMQVIMSDMHSASTHALFLSRVWRGRDTQEISATPQQKRIRKHFEEYAAEVKKARQGKQVRLIHNGDAIDGDHHHSGDVCTLNQQEQADIHVELMAEFQDRIGWTRGDELYYVKGTDIHTGSLEDYIGRELGAVKDGDFGCHYTLELTSNGRRSLFVHHGPGAGEGANEGNSIRNWLRNVTINLERDNKPTPDIIYTAHVHKPCYSTYVTRVKDNYRTIHGIITPSWQMKTRYAWEKVPFSVNKIGGTYQVIKADGVIAEPVFRIMDLS